MIYTFDCYGTLIDWLNGVREIFSKLYPEYSNKVNEFIRYWGEADWREVSKGVYKPYREILKIGFKYALDKLNLDYNDDILRQMVESIYIWKSFPEVPLVLKEVREMGVELGIISNTDRDFIYKSIENIGVEFDYIIVAEDIRIYKPDHRVFIEAGRRLPKDKWIHISAYPEYDIIPASKAGIDTIFIDRYDYIGRGYAVEATYIVKNFRDLIDLTKKIL